MSMPCCSIFLVLGNVASHNEGGSSGRVRYHQVEVSQKLLRECRGTMSDTMGEGTAMEGREEAMLNVNDGGILQIAIYWVEQLK